jgi:hypothetical protein
MSSFHIIEYHPPERISSAMSSGGPVGQPHRSHSEAVAEINRLFVKDGWKVTGYNEEQDYFWGRDAAPTTRRRVLRVER